MPHALEVVLSDRGNVFARKGQLLVQVRCGAISVELIDRVLAEVRLMLASTRGPCGFIAVLEPSAPTPSLAVRERQRQIVKASETIGDVKMALVVVGEGVQAMLTRTISRAILHQSKKHRVVDDVAEAARWVSPHIGAPVLDVVAVVQEARRLLLDEVGSPAQ